MYNLFLNYMLRIFVPIFEMYITFGLGFGFLLFFGLSYLKMDKKIRAKVFLFSTGVLAGIWLFSCVIISLIAKKSVFYDVCIWGLIGVIGFILGFLVERNLLPMMEKLLSAGTKETSLSRGTKTDIRDLVKNQKKLDIYDPKKFYKKGAWFIGLDEKKNPVYYKEKNLKHILVTGKSGSGKSALMTNLGDQAVDKNECVIVIDPKKNGDVYCPHILAAAAKRNNKDFVYIDLASDKEQINIFADGEKYQNETLLKNAMNLKDNDSDGDYFRSFGREEAYKFAQRLKEGETLVDYYNQYGPKLKEQKETRGFAVRLGELARISSLHAKDGISLKQCIDNKAVIYIVGDWENSEIIKAKRMVLARIVQIISQRPNDLEEPDQVCIIADELKFQTSSILSSALALIRDRGAHLILGCQTLGNLRDCPDGMDKEVFQADVLGNCGLKFTYSVNDVETADYFADLSGKIRIDEEVRKVEKGISLTETIDGSSKQLKQSQTEYIDRNMLLTFPQGVGVFFNESLALVAHVSPNKAERSIETKKIRASSSQKNTEKSDNKIIFEDIKL